MLHQRRFQSVELSLVGQPPVPQEKNRLFKSRLFGERVNVVALIRENSRIAVDVTNPRLRRNDSFETRTGNCHDSSVSLLGWKHHSITAKRSDFRRRQGFCAWRQVLLNATISQRRRGLAHE